MNAPRQIGTVISQLMSRRGYASVAVDDALFQSVATAVGPMLADSFRIGKLRSGILQVYAIDSVTIQELTFQKRQILKRLHQDHPQAKIHDLRFKILAPK